MNQHLSDQQIDEWIIGERSPDVESHLHSCRDCAGRVARVAEPLALFRGAVRNWSEEQMSPSPAARFPVAPSRWWWQVGLAIAALWILIALPVYRHRQAAVTAAQDELLLQQVEQELSRKVPAPMEPLAKLMTNDLSR